MNIFKFIDWFKRKGDSVQKIIVGLGNFGVQYENTRHNAGFDAVDLLANKFDFKFSNMKKFEAFGAIGDIVNVKCLLLKPLTFMNNSGISVEAACKFYKVDVCDVIVLVDDISFEPGKIRIKRSGSAGTHNGLKSIIYSTGREDFIRIKIGVGKKPHPDFDLANWVLSKFEKDVQVEMKKAYEKVVEAIELILSGDIDKAMNRFN